MRPGHNQSSVARKLLPLVFWPLLCLGQMPPVRVVEVAVESQAASVHLPALAPGLALVADCDGCRDHELHLPTDAQYTINGKPASLQDVHRAALLHADATITLHYLPATRQVKRVDLTVF